MAETATVRVFEGDKQRIKDMADARGERIRDVVADLLREPVFRCPECETVFDPQEVDPSTVREHGVMTSGLDKVVKGQRDVKDFECPTCESRVRPQEIETVDADGGTKKTADELGVPSESSDSGSSAEPE